MTGVRLVRLGLTRAAQTRGMRLWRQLYPADLFGFGLCLAVEKRFDDHPSHLSECVDLHSPLASPPRDYFHRVNPHLGHATS